MMQRACRKSRRPEKGPGLSYLCEIRRKIGSSRGYVGKAAGLKKVPDCHICAKYEERPEAAEGMSEKPRA